MASYATIRVAITKAYGLPWRVGDVVAGELYFRDKDDNLITLGSGTSIETEVHEWDGTEWDSYSAASISTSATATNGIHDFSFEPEDDETFRLVFKLTGDYKAQEDVTIKVIDPLDLD